jgi:hypothetical protein
VLTRILGVLGCVTLAAAAAPPPARALATNEFRAPAAGATLTGGSVAEVRWAAAEQEGADEAELVLSTDGGRTFPIRVSAELDPGATAYRWRVPELPARSARLALRVGAGRERGRERIVLVSAEFAIASDAPQPQSLASGPGESWTEQALTERSAGDLLGTSVAAGHERLVSVETETEMNRPAPTLSLVAPASTHSGLAPAAAPRTGSSQPSAPPASAPRPLRL